jgi:hypothetical protein
MPVSSKKLFIFCKWVKTLAWEHILKYMDGYICIVRHMRGIHNTFSHYLEKKASASIWEKKASESELILIT